MKYYITGIGDLISYSKTWVLLLCIEGEGKRGELSIMMAEEDGDSFTQQTGKKTGQNCQK